MGSGCLSPKPRIGQIYVDVINLIHEEALKIHAEDSYLFDAVRQRIMKTGHLRKLMDYLVSHKTRIPQAMSHNCALTNQTKSKSGKYAGLLVCDHIIKGVCERQHQANKQQISRSLKLINGTQNSSVPTDTLQGKTLITQTSQKEANILSVGNYIAGEKSKLEQCYFNTLLGFLKQDQPHLYLRVLKSLQRYSEFHFQSNSHSFIRNHPLHVSEKCENVLQILLQNISKEYQKEQTLKAYAGLIHTMKWYQTSLKNSDGLRFILRLWIIQKERETLLTNDCQTILRQYIQHYINHQHSQVVYQAVIELYDQFEFADIRFFEMFLMEVLEQLDLKSQFLRGLFLYLLGYVSWCKQESLQSRWNTIYPSMMNEGTRNRLPNIYQYKTKINAIKTIRKWLEYELVDCNQILTYTHLMFIQAYLFNVIQQLDKKFTKNAKEVMDQLFKVCSQSQWSNLTVASKTKVTQTLLQEVNWIHADQAYQTMLIDSAGGILEAIIQLQTFHELISPITTNLSHSNKLKIIKLNIQFVKKVKGAELSNIQLQESIQNFLYSVYDNLCIQGMPYDAKFDLVNQVLQFFVAMLGRNQKSLILAYLEQIIKAQNIHSELKTKYTLFFYGYTINSLLVGRLAKDTVSEQLRNINQKILLNKQISPEIEQRITSLTQIHKLQDIRLSNIKIQLKKTTQKQNLKQNKKSFNALFHPNINRNDLKLKVDQGTANFSLSSASIFSRKRSFQIIDQFQPSEASFRQILDIINR